MKVTHLKTFLRSLVFAIGLVVSAAVLTAVLRNQVGKSIVGLFLLAFLLVSIVYAASRYLRFLWALSGRFIESRPTGTAESIASTPAQEHGR